MKPFYCLFAFILLSGVYSQVAAQTKLQQYVKDASEDLAQKRYADARTSLQMALNEVNTIMGKQLLAALPLELGGMKADTADDVNGSGVPGMLSAGGLSVSRDYNGPDDKNATLSIMTNSSAATSINMIITNPTMIDQTDGMQKIVTIGTVKGLLSWDAEEQTGDVQIPIGSSVISFSSDGFSSADAVLALVSKLDMASIKKSLGE